MAPCRESGGIDLRAVARKCLEAAVEAVDGRRLVAEFLAQQQGGEVAIDGPVVLVAVGKAALAMARGALEVLGGRIVRGVVVVPESATGKIDGFAEHVKTRIEVIPARHPLPDAGSVSAAESVSELTRDVSGDETLLVLLSGGASSLLSLPAGNLSLADLQQTTELLLRAGVSIDDLNTVRKHLDQLKGGGLARLAVPARVVGLVLSDVVGDRLDVIASGPLVPDSTTFEDAVDVVRGHGLWGEIPEAVRRRLLAGADGEIGENPVASDACFRQTFVEIVGNNELAASAAMAEAERQGFAARLLTTSLAGEARRVGRRMAMREREVRDLHRPAGPPVCLVAAGETTVTVKGTGKGGRNQELALSAAIGLRGRERLLVAAFGSDGIDGPTDAAGAWVDGETVERGKRLGLDAAAFLEANDAYTYFAALDDLIITGPTGTNVMDLVLMLVA